MDLPSAQDVLGHVIANRYLVESFCDQSGASSSYFAYHLALDRPVLLRVLGGRTGLDREACRRALQAAERAARVSHAHVSRTIDVGLLGERWPFVVSFDGRGRTLASLLAQSGPFELNPLLRIGQRLASALGAAHAAGVVHGAISLDQLWLEGSAPLEGSLKVLGFGVSELPGPDLYGSTSGIYPSSLRRQVELGLDGRAPFRGDIHAIGNTLYQLATGFRPAWVPGDVAAILDSDFAGSPWTSHRALTRALAMIVQRCLHVLPDTNYEQPSQVLGDLERLAETAATLTAQPAGPAAPIRTVHTPPRPYRAAFPSEPKVIVRGG